MFDFTLSRDFSNSNPVLDVAKRTSIRIRDNYYGVLKPRSRMELALEHLGFSKVVNPCGITTVRLNVLKRLGK